MEPRWRLGFIPIKYTSYFINNKWSFYCCSTIFFKKLSVFIRKHYFQLFLCQSYLFI